jgi:hypothetical protein
VLAAAFAQQVDHVLEIFDVAALVAGDGDALHVFLQRGGRRPRDRAVVAEVDHFAAMRLKDAPHDVDRRVVAVEQRRRGDETHLVSRSPARHCQRLGGRGPAHIRKISHCLHRSVLWLAAARRWF